MTAPYRKKLIEVALPLKAINEASAREKSIRHGHPSTLHLWWARRPLAACRAVLFASLVDDPDSDPVYRRADGTVDEDRAGLKRAELFNLIEELVQWENSNNPRVINAARAEIARCVASRKMELAELAKETIIFGKKKGEKHPKGAVSGEGVTTWDVLTMKAKSEVINAFLAEYAPPVLDPFCGGGSIPLEAQRLGLRAYGSDLNPVPVLITKALIELPPKFAGKPPVHPPESGEQARSAGQWHGAQGLAEDVRYYGQWMREEAERRIGQFYPKIAITKEMANDRPDLEQYVGHELAVIAWLWARAVQCNNPACGIQSPLISSFVIAKKGKATVYFEPTVNRTTTPPSVSYKVRVGQGKPPESLKLGRGGKFRCVACGQPIDIDYLRKEGRQRRIGFQLTTIVVEGTNEQVFLDPVKTHEAVAVSAVGGWSSDLELPDGARHMTPTLYGMLTQADLFSPRQRLALTTFSNLVKEAESRVLAAAESISGSGHADRSACASYAQAVATYLACAVGRSADYWSTLTIWAQTFVAHTFGRNALSMVWDYPEANPLSDSTGNWTGAIDWIARVIQQLPAAGFGIVQQLDARVAGKMACVFSTDPPYYDNVPYADLSDYFYVWLRRTVGHIYPALTSTLATPKSQELVADSRRHGGWDEAAAHFESGMRLVFERLRAEQVPDYPLTVYYAFKQTETESDEGSPDQTASTGWETMLQALLDSGLAINGTWPLRTERPGRLRESSSNALASSIVLVCRPRSADSPLTTRKDFLGALRAELPDALRNLQHGNIAPVDLAQSAIGPGMAVFTRYSKVIESNGGAMTVRAALGIINQVLDEVLAEQEGDFDADTRWALAWFEQFGMSDGPFGVAETLSKAKNTAVNALVDSGIATSRSGKVRLLTRAELPENWDPVTDTRLRNWEVVQHLIRILDTKGESGAAALLNRLGGMGETARELAYRLYSICERKKWADEALAYNSLVIAWPELSRLALSSRVRQPESQRELF